MMNVHIDKARVAVTVKFDREGSVLKQNISTRCDGVETRLEVQSDAPPARIADVVRNAENGCFVMQALLKPVPVTASTALNGDELAITR